MKKFFSLVLALVMALSLTTVAWGADLDATPSNIDAVIANASAGDTIQLAAGDYASLSIPLSLTNLTIKGGAGVNLAVLSLSKTNKGVAGGPLYGAPDGLTLDGLTIAAVSSVEGGTVLKNLTIKNCTFTAGINFGPNSSVDGLTIEKCTFSNITGQAIQFNCKNASSHYAKNIVIKDNVFDNISDNAINFSNSSAQGSVNISGNNIEVTADRAVRISAAAGAELTISNNEITDGVDNGEVIKVSGSGYAASVKDNALPTNSKVVLDNIVDDAIEVTMDASGNITDGEFYTAPTVPADYEAVYTNGKYMVVPKTSAAGTTTTLKDADKYDIYGITGTTSVKAANADITKKVTDNVTVTAGGKTTTTYTATTYSDGVNVYVEVDSSIASYKLVKDNTIVAYMVNLADLGNVPTTTKVATAFVEAKKVADQKCGDITADGVVVDGKTYIAGGANWAVLNGKFVTYTEILVPTVPHDYAAGSYNVKDKSVATVKCVDCKATWNVLTAKQVATMSPKAYTMLTTGTAEVIGLYIPAAAAPAAGTTTGTLVESAQTFDAGIAMYVGMSVMAAAGSAVVIGKKKD